MSFWKTRSAKIGVLASGEAMTRFIVVLGSIVLVRLLDVENYSTYRQTMLVYQFVSPLLALSLPQALYYFMPGEKTRARALLVENILLLMLTAVFLALFLLAGGNDLLARRFNNPALSRPLTYLAAYPLLLAPIGGLNACLVIRNRVGNLTIFNIVSRLVMLAALVAPCLVWHTAEAAVAGTIAGALVVLPPGLALMFSACREGESRPSLRSMWAQLRFSVPVGLNVMVEGISGNLDKVIVASLCSVASFAVYSVGAIRIPMVYILTVSAFSVLLPELRTLYLERKHGEILALWQKAIVQCALFIFPVMVFAEWKANDLMKVLFSSKYEASANVFRIYLLALPAGIADFSALFKIAGQTGKLLLRALGMLALNAALTILLIRRFGYMGAAAGSCLAVYLWTAPFSLAHMASVLHTPVRDILPLGKLGRAVLCALVPGVVLPLPGLAGVSNSVLDLAISLPLYAVGTLLMMQAMKLVDIRQLWKVGLAMLAGRTATAGDIAHE